MGTGPIGVYGQGDDSNNNDNGGNGIKALGGGSQFGSGGNGVEASGGFSPIQGGKGLVVNGGDSARPNGVTTLEELVSLPLAATLPVPTSKAIQQGATAWLPPAGAQAAPSLEATSPAAGSTPPAAKAASVLAALVCSLLEASVVIAAASFMAGGLALSPPAAVAILPGEPAYSAETSTLTAVST